MFLRMIQWLRSLYPRQISSLVLVFVGPCPVLCCFAVLLCGETQIWLGDLRVVFGCVFVLFGLFFVMICLSFWTTRVLFFLLFTAYAIVRTVPSAIGQIGGEKKTEAKTTPKTNTNKNNPHKTQTTTQPQSSDVTGTSLWVKKISSGKRW